MLTQPIRGTHLFPPTLLRFLKTDAREPGFVLVQDFKAINRNICLGGRSTQMASVVSERELREAEVAQ